MKLENNFTVGVPIEQTWQVFQDVERLAPSMPGAQLQEIDGDQYRGIVKLKVGPVNAQYKGAATFDDVDEAARTIVIRAEGRETKGQGNAKALITVSLGEDGDGTAVHVGTDLQITGRIAQFGRGVMADVAGKLVGQFVESLEADLESEREGEPTPTQASGTGTIEAPPAGGVEAEAAATSEAPDESSGPLVIESAEPEPIDILEVSGAPIAKRVLPIVVVAVLVLVVWLVLRRRRRA